MYAKPMFRLSCGQANATGGHCGPRLMVALGLKFYLKQRKIDKEKASRYKAHPVISKLDCFDTSNDYKENLNQTTRRSPIDAQTKLDTDRNVKKN